MATVDPHDVTPAGTKPDAGAPDATEPADDGRAPHEKRRNWWMWACAGLAVLVLGLALWGVNRQMALDDSQQQATESQQQVAELEAQAEEAENNGGAVVAAIKGAYETLEKQLGAANEDLDATQQDVAEAQQAADKAEQDAAAAKQDAAQAEDQTAKAKAQAEEAKAKAEGAQSRAAIVKSCAKAYVSALGALFEGDSVRAQASAVRQNLQSISDDCSNALAGS
jgi:chromosome segregation ATPase